MDSETAGFWRDIAILAATGLALFSTGASVAMAVSGEALLWQIPLNGAAVGLVLAAVLHFVARSNVEGVERRG